MVRTSSLLSGQQPPFVSSCLKGSDRLYTTNVFTRVVSTPVTTHHIHHNVCTQYLDALHKNTFYCIMRMGSFYTGGKDGQYTVNAINACTRFWQTYCRNSYEFRRI